MCSWTFETLLCNKSQGRQRSADEDPHRDPFTFTQTRLFCAFSLPSCCIRTNEFCLLMRHDEMTETRYLFHCRRRGIFVDLEGRKFEFVASNSPAAQYVLAAKKQISWFYASYVRGYFGAEPDISRVCFPWGVVGQHWRVQASAFCSWTGFFLHVLRDV